MWRSIYQKETVGNVLIQLGRRCGVARQMRKKFWSDVTLHEENAVDLTRLMNTKEHEPVRDKGMVK